MCEFGCFFLMCIFCLCLRALDALFNFLLVWYYCTLTIRESILISNGSRSATNLLSPQCFILMIIDNISAARRLAVVLHTEKSCILQCLSSTLFQDQRLVGFPSLRVNLPVRSHAHLVSVVIHFSLEEGFTLNHHNCSKYYNN